MLIPATYTFTVSAAAEPFWWHWGPTVILSVIGCILIVLLSVILYRIYNNQVSQAAGGKPGDGANPDLHTRQAMAMTVIVIALSGILVLSIVVLCAKFNLATAQFVFGAVLPLLATWVGTVLAYYFSRENLAAATQSVAAMADRLSGMERLQSIPVQSKWRRLDKIKYQTVEPTEDAATKLTTFLADGVERNIILFKSGALRYLIYTTVIKEYHAKFAVPGFSWPTGATSVADLTLAHLTSDATLKKMFLESWRVVPLTATLADVKKAMDAPPQPCNDVFVTLTGKPTEPVLGWVTDNNLAENSKV